MHRADDPALRPDHGPGTSRKETGAAAYGGFLVVGVVVVWYGRVDAQTSTTATSTQLACEFDLDDLRQIIGYLARSNP